MYAVVIAYQQVHVPVNQDLASKIKMPEHLIKWGRLWKTGLCVKIGGGSSQVVRCNRKPKGHVFRLECGADRNIEWQLRVARGRVVRKHHAGICDRQTNR